MTKRSIILWIGLLGAALAGAQEPTLGLRHPTLSPDGEMVAFSYQGDLWVWSDPDRPARRITNHVGYDGKPAWSPDGRWIAFTSDREGFDDVYVIDPEGGSPRRLTYRSTGDDVVGWSPDSREVLFTSQGRHRHGSLYAVPLSGGMPRRMLKEGCRFASLAPDGTIAFHRGFFRWHRKGGRGPGGSQIWLKKAEDTEPHQITSFEGDDLWPLWVADRSSLVFVSHRSGTPNLFRLDGPDGQPVQLTHHEGDMVRFPMLSADGSWAVYEYAGRIGRVPVAGGSTELLAIRAPSDPKEGPVERQVLTAKAQEFAPSPDGRQMAVCLRGELFVTYTDEPDEAMNVTEHTAWDGHPAWSPDGRILYFLSHRDGPLAIHAVNSTDPDRPDLASSRHREIRRISPEGMPWIDQFALDPEGERFALITEEPDQLMVLPIEAGRPKELDQAPALHAPAWSPDGRWIAYEKNDGLINTDIFVVPARGGEAKNVTVSAFDDLQPRFTPDGRQLVWSSERNEDYDIFAAWLTLAEHHKSKADRKVERRRKDAPAPDGEDSEESSKGKKGKKDKKEEDEEAGTPEVLIDFDRIDERARALVGGPGNEIYFRLTSDSEWILFHSVGPAGGGLYRAKLDGSKSEPIAAGLEPRDGVLTKGDRLFVLSDGGGVTSLNADGSDRKPISYRAALELDRRIERAEAFREVRDFLGLYFYRADMNGVDWPSLYEHYRPMVDACETDRDAYDFMRLLIGELNASHTGLWPDREDHPPSSGVIGWELEPDAPSGLYRVSYVLPGSPADRPETKISVGEFLLAIDGREIAAGENLYQYLQGKQDREVEITVSPKPKAKGSRTVVLRPMQGEKAWGLMYRDKVHRNRAAVEDWSDGRLGYSHVQYMGKGALRAFLADILARHVDQEGLVLDVRGNPGGYLHDDLVGFLRRTPYAYNQPRGWEKRPEPTWNWFKPVILLVDSHSFSDAEIFPHIFREMGLGTVVGTPTTGGVIGTGGTHLLDGSWLRLPGTGWYATDGTNLEGTGAGVDILVENPLVVEQVDQDLQLQRAVKELLSQIDGKTD